MPQVKTADSNLCFSLHRTKYAAKVPTWLLRQVQKTLSPTHAQSCGNMFCLVQHLASTYVAQARLNGWTYGAFMTLVADCLRGRVNSERCLRRYVSWLAECGVIRLERHNGWRRGTIVRVHMLHILEANGTPQQMKERAAQIREVDRLRQARHRAKKKGLPQVAARPTLAGKPILDAAALAKEVDALELEWADTPAKMAVSPQSRPHGLTPNADARPDRQTTSPALPKIKTIPSIPSSAGGWPSQAAQEKETFGQSTDEDESNEAGGEGSDGSGGSGQQGPAQTAPKPPTGHLDLAGEIYALAACGDAGRAKLKAQMPAVYADLARQHPCGVRGVASLPEASALKVCREVARRHAPKKAAQPAQERCARLRRKVDLGTPPATTQQVQRALVDCLGVSGSAAIRAHALAAQGLSLAMVEATLVRICRHTKMGSNGPTGLRIPGSLQAYVDRSFRRAKERTVRSATSQRQLASPQ